LSQLPHEFNEINWRESIILMFVGLVIEVINTNSTGQKLQFLRLTEINVTCCGVFNKAIIKS
jgi:hypothetical protein